MKRIREVLRESGLSESDQRAVLDICLSDLCDRARCLTYASLYLSRAGLSDEEVDRRVPMQEIVDAA